MRHLTLGILVAFISSGVAAQEHRLASTPEGKARWNACYKETRLIYRTRNLSRDDYREAIKEARKEHMDLCMTRATPPASVKMATPTDQNPESGLVSWAGSP
jgi:hypothetical protein